jgi:hypothetical protein
MQPIFCHQSLWDGSQGLLVFKLISQSRYACSPALFSLFSLSSLSSCLVLLVLLVLLPCPPALSSYLLPVSCFFPVFLIRVFFVFPVQMAFRQGCPLAPPAHVKL